MLRAARRICYYYYCTLARPFGLNFTCFSRFSWHKFPVTRNVNRPHLDRLYEGSPRGIFLPCTAVGQEARRVRTKKARPGGSNEGVIFDDGH